MQAARDLANNHGTVNEEKKNNLLQGFDQACHDAKEDVDLVRLLQKPQNIIDAADSAHGAAVQRDGLGLITNLSAASEQIKKRDEKTSRKGWKDRVGAPEDKGHKKAH